MQERLQKIISQAGIASRRAAEKMIADGRVKVDGKVVTELGRKVDPSRADIRVDGKRIKAAEQHVYFLLNKPKGYLSTAHDERGRRTVLNLLPEVNERVYPVGRLDNNTEGLLLITNDGTLMNGLLHPKYEVEKTYIARIAGEPDELALDRLRQGIRLEDGMTAPAKVKLLEQAGGQSRVEISIHEGRNRQVRRMFAAIGCDVRALKRVRFAGLTLQGVKRGKYRALTKEELLALFRLAGIER
ncbi:23S rRNA pseudouridine2605 synthase [Selenomonas sp. GACV-9]|uniref:pseudouridine synthase n=1 Tax=Selenomonas sp. GACV-9 TaxID=3158782 RepID=UPI0008ED750F|nr:23S rRNA pseudouridine2605 synthase [Selenomonas ruminantium]